MKYLHGTMSQEKLTDLAELSMERKSFLKCDMDEVIDDFVKKKRGGQERWPYSVYPMCVLYPKSTS